jgi:hypothetical protein
MYADACKLKARLSQVTASHHQIKPNMEQDVSWACCLHELAALSGHYDDVEAFKIRSKFWSDFFWSELVDVKKQHTAEEHITHLMATHELRGKVDAFEKTVKMEFAQKRARDAIP